MKKLIFSSILVLNLGLVGCSDDTKKEDIKNSTETSSEQAEQNTTETSTKLDILNITVSLKEAVAVFQSAHPEAQINSVELESNMGNLQYEITGLDTSYEYEMRIDANSKEVLADMNEIERETKPFLDFTEIIDPADAIQTASTSDQVSGMSPISWKLEAEYGAQNYSIKYGKVFSEVEVYVDALTGELLGVELDD